jgi:hypothetical protein
MTSGTIFGWRECMGISCGLLGSFVYRVLSGNVGYRIFGFRVGQDHAAVRLPRGCLGECTAVDASDGSRFRCRGSGCAVHAVASWPSAGWETIAMLA